MEVLSTAIATVVVGALALIGNIYAARTSARKTEMLLSYRLDQLEKKVDKHNSLVERMYCAERRLDVLGEQMQAAARRADSPEGYKQ
jgi:hypothetical protein